MSTLAEGDEEQNWAMAAWVHHPTKRSIHTTQLGTFSCSVHSCEKTVSATKVVHAVRDPSRLKFCITGGTDNPTIKLRLSNDAPNTAWRNLAISPSPNVIAMKFHLLPHTTHQAQIPKFERQVIRFNPMYSGVEFDQHQPIEGNTYGFSLEVASLTWQREISGPPAVLIEWQAEKNTMLTIDLGSVAQDHPHYEMSRDFIKIATIPVTLRETHNLRLEEVWNLEAQRPNRFVKPTGVKRTPLKTRCDLRGVYEPHPVVFQFDSNIATEYYLKLPYILNIDAAAEQMSSTCDGYLRHKCIKARKYIPDASDDTVVFLAYIPIDGECDDGDIIFPLEGDLAKVVWIHKTLKDERPIVWQGKVLMSPSQHDRQWNVAMIAWIKDSTDDYEALLKRDFQPRFTFKSPETGNTTLLKFVDRILFGHPILNIRYRNWIRTFMIGTDDATTSLLFDIHFVMEHIESLWEDDMYHYITHNTLILATTFGNLPSILIRHFGAQHLIADEVCNATDMSFWGGMARFANTLKSGCGIGDPEQNGPFVAGGSRNYMRDQLSIDAMSRMIRCYGRHLIQTD
ncbi:hypothetical protein EAE99_009159 [Botrytis elliptica]|nr:hypothetical protein EAE99_009159 [Botrytis elliptica]